MAEKYYRLNPECFLVKGIKGGMIINIYEGRVISLDESFSDLLLKSEHGMPVDMENENLHKLIEMGWADVYDAPVFIDKVRVTNIYGKRHMWKTAPIVNIAVLQITGECDKECENCFDDRCPLCKRDDDNSPLDLDGWKKVIDRLAIYSTETIILTGGNPTLNPDYEAILDYALSKGMNAFIHVASAAACRKIKNKYNIFFSALDDEDVAQAGNLLREKSNIVRVFISERKASPALPKDKRIQYINSDNLKIKKSNMFSSGIDPFRFVLKQMYNECFFGKISIDQTGDILPCLGATDSTGNILEDDFVEAFKRLIEDYWYVSTDDREDEHKCRHCENRYVCRNLCIFSSDRDQCSYNVEELKWSLQ